MIHKRREVRPVLQKKTKGQLRLTTWKHQQQHTTNKRPHITGDYGLRL